MDKRAFCFSEAKKKGRSHVPGHMLPFYCHIFILALAT